jgi:hypothetical protein
MSARESKRQLKVKARLNYLALPFYCPEFELTSQLSCE